MAEDVKFGKTQGGLPSWFARVPTTAVCDLSITPGELRILAVICSYANNQGFAWPNRSTIYERSGLKAATFDRALKKLKAKGHLQIVSRHRSHSSWRHVMGNVYRVVFDKEMKTDRLIADMKHEATMTGTRPELGLDGAQEGDERQVPASGMLTPKTERDGVTDDPRAVEGTSEEVSKHKSVERGDQLVEAGRVAMAYVVAARETHGQIRLANPRAIEAALKHLEDGLTPVQILELAKAELARRRTALRDAPHHLGDCLAGVKNPTDRLVC